jgi:hypothetical protein
MVRKPVTPDPADAPYERWAADGFGSEPSLCEVLADPIIRAVMQCDGVSLVALGSVIARARRRLRDMPSSGPSSPETRRD